MAPTPPPALSLTAIAALRARGFAPAYDPQHCRVGIVHIGVGNFHRAHQAVHVDAALASGESDWAISGWSLRNDAMRAALAPQDGLYTLLVRSDANTRARVIASIREIGCARATPQTLVARLASPDTKIVSLTITEKGYCLAPDGAPDWREPALAADLANEGQPTSALGWLAAGLAARQIQAPRAALSVLSCDNLSHNGRTLSRALEQFLRARSQGDLAEWVAKRVSFPDSMVDRIVPASTESDRSEAATLTGFADAWPVATEPFSQWVVEDRFAAGRPRLEESGVLFSDDVAGWEQMKLRLLNAAHSAIAYLGLAAGWATVDAAIANPALAALIQRLWTHEAIAALPTRLQGQAPAYCARLLERFANPSLAHRTAQIAADGSKKIPLRWLPTMQALSDQHRPWPCLALALAAWIHCLAGGSNRSDPIGLNDPLAERLGPLAAHPDCMTAVLAVFEAVPSLQPLSQRNDTHAPVAQALAALRSRHAAAVIAELIQP